ncbi:hypothetical protein BS50DRAFT_575854 [Corynespora cassiicola Philippines]|uniref:Uncharacterized protein n=1 Tax=Corynespora cassiicola Philippines TaxID=1448308 RepID=A0A2T2NG43_CORCC|nr:hypothetical protein BS50DRAFT_575854 [Corynespora cassiicola Philippines]
MFRRSGPSLDSPKHRSPNTVTSPRYTNQGTSPQTPTPLLVISSAPLASLYANLQPPHTLPKPQALIPPRRSQCYPMGHHNRHFAGDRHALNGVWSPPSSAAK